jgi:hypothetical protein
MGIATDVTRPQKTPKMPASVPIQDRVRRLPEALLLATGYYASRVPPLREFLRRID